MSYKITEVAMFISSYLKAMHANGAYVSRCNRCTRRIAMAFGYDISINFFFNNTALMLSDKANPNIQQTIVLSNPPAHTNFAAVRELSALSWEIHDRLPSIAQCNQNLDLVLKRTNSPRSALLGFFICGLAFASLCRLFGGDFGAMILVFFAAFSGAGLRFLLTKQKVDLRLQYLFLSVFSSSFVILFYKLFGADFTQTLHIGVATSTLYLIPGVFFINSVIDILDNHILVGFSRIVSISILILCMAIGVYLSLAIFGIRGL